jgi:putative transposase
VIGSSQKLYLAAVLDLSSRFRVGWAVSAVNDRRLTFKALDMALERRWLEAGLLRHSDRGCTYTAEDYQAVLTARDRYDNAVIESFFATVKTELAERFPSYGEAKMALFD